MTEPTAVSTTKPYPLGNIEGVPTGQAKPGLPQDFTFGAFTLILGLTAGHSL